VFTGPADHPDTIAQTASATPKKKKTAAKTAGAEKPAKAADKPAKTEETQKKTAKPAKTAKPKVTSVNQ
jgi:hypothetical protein